MVWIWHSQKYNVSALLKVNLVVYHYNLVDKISYVLNISELDFHCFHAFFSFWIKIHMNTLYTKWERLSIFFEQYIHKTEHFYVYFFKIS